MVAHVARDQPGQVEGNAPPRSHDEARRYLRAYLNDHRAGATAGVARARRSAHKNRGTELGAELERIADDLREDEASLIDIARQLGCSPNRTKQLMARVVRRSGFMKLEVKVWLRGYSPLDRMLELELLLGAIDRKRSVWRALQWAYVPVARQNNLDVLLRRANDQRARLRGFHAAGAADAFGIAGIAVAADPISAALQRLEDWHRA